MELLTDIRIYISLFFLIQLVVFRFETERFYQYWEEIFKKKRFYYGILSAIFTYLLIYKYLNWLSLAPSGADFSHFDYAMWNGAWTGKLNVSIDDNNYYLNLLGNHFAPFLYLFAPLYWIHSSHFIPQFLQVLALLLSFIVAKKVSTYFLEEVKSPYAESQSFFLGLGLLFNEMTIRIFKFEFHHEVFYIPLLLLLCLSCYQYFEKEAKNFKAITLLLLLVFSIKEDAPLVIASLFLYYSIFSKGRKTTAIFLLITCASYFLFTMKVLLPYFQKYEASSYSGLWSKYGTNVIDVAKSILLNPYEVVKDILSAKGFYKLLIPFFFLPLASSYCLILASSFIIHFTSDYSPLRTLSLYYSAPILPLCFFAFLLTLKKIKLKILNYVIPAFLLFSLINAFGSLKFHLPDKESLETRKKASLLLNSIPETSSEVIFISGKLLAQTTYRKDLRRIWNFKEIERKDIKAFLIYTTDQDFPFSKEDVLKYRNKAKELPQMELIYEDSQLVLIQKKK